jgi:DNA-binding CsgD family transcriptional regulator/PAS domain-containing protein
MEQRIMHAKLDTVISAIDSLLAGALDSEQLPVAIERMRTLFGGSKACFARFGPNMGPDDAIATNPDPELQKLCYGELAAEFVSLAGVVASVPVGQVYQDDELIGRDRFHSTRVWREWMAPQDMYGGMACRTLEGSGSFWFVDVQRGRNQERFDAEDIALFERMSAIARRVAELQRHFGHLKIQRDMARHALDTLSVAILIVDQSLQLVYANAMADDILAHPNGTLNLRAGRLSARSRADQATLRQLVAGSGEKAAMTSSCRNQMLLRAPGGDGQSISVSVAPLPGGYGLANGPSDVMLLARPLESAINLAATAQQLFGLTDAEARFASALASGQSLAEAAEDQGVRISTARTHLARIFQKTGTRQQSQVAALLRSAELPMRG